jgi:hypothetical protein
MIHGAGMQRLHDIALLARQLRAGGPPLFAALLELANAEELQPIALFTALAFAAWMAAIPHEFGSKVRHNMSWILQREELPAYLRCRSQATDGWFASGGRVFGPAMRQVVPRVPVINYSSNDILLKPLRFIGRIVAGICALTYAKIALRRVPAMMRSIR